MSSTAPTPEPRPSIFLSYASEDRAAARALRDALIATGLDVWYDESKLGGGDAWDQKIRRQIRDCDFFMPVISHATEQRKEGYFRREWRLAAERTMDMADDVLFLLPVAIDDTSDAGARVPDKFLAVQWLRLPAGHPTPELEALARRLLEGEHSVAPPSRPAGARSHPAPPRAAADLAAPPPMPPFPHLAQSGVAPALKFAAEICWWALSAGWLLFNRAPRYVRVFLALWAAFFLVSRCSRDRPEVPKVEAAKSVSADEFRRALAAAATKVPELLVNAEPGTKGPDAGDTRTSAKFIILAPFALPGDTTPAGHFATAVFTSSLGRLVTARPDAMGNLESAAADWDPPALMTAATKAGATLLLTGRIVPSEEPALTVNLLRVTDGTVVWTRSYPIDTTEPTVAVAEISRAVLEVLPAKP
jgi:hypothetical protein